jgi:hypothetical protein
MFLHFAVHVMCDVCGVKSGEIARVEADQRWNIAQGMPEGWTDSSNMSLQARDPYGTFILHLCPQCSALDIRALSELVREKFEPKAELSSGDSSTG